MKAIRYMHLPQNKGFINNAKDLIVERGLKRFPFFVAHCSSFFG